MFRSLLVALKPSLSQSYVIEHSVELHDLVFGSTARTMLHDLPLPLLLDR